MEPAANLKNTLPSLCSVKLDRNNYMLWKSLVLPLIKGSRLDGFIFGTKKFPDQQITEGSNKVTNPAYEEWIVSDQQLLGWLFNSMTEDIATQLLHCETSKELWDDAQSLAGAHRRSRVTLLKSEFHSTRKGSMKMEDYLIKMKTLSDNLKLAGSPVSSADLIIQTLTGLDSEYNAIVVQLSDRSDLTWVDLQAQLLAFENRLEQLNNLSNLTINSSANPSANVVTRSDYKGKKPFSNGGWRGANQRGGYRGGRGRARNFSNKPVCQLCKKPGHVSSHCYYRFDKSYMGQPPEENNHRNNFGGQSHTAFITSPHTTQDPEWYFDSGASNHVTHDSNRFQEMTENDGQGDRNSSGGRDA